MPGNGGKIRERTLYYLLPQSVETSYEGKVTILWNQQVRTDRTIPDNTQGTCLSIDFAISGGRNVTKKEAQKILNYKDLIMEVQRM